MRIGSLYYNMPNKEQYKYRKENGICVRCGKRKSENGKTRCLECKEKANKSNMDTYYFFKKIGMCVICCKEKADQGYVTCLSCRMEKRERDKRYLSKEENSERRKEYLKNRYRILKENSRCVSCGKSIENHTLCDKCYKKYFIRQRVKRSHNTGIIRSERPNYGECYICGGKLSEESKKLCDRCLENARKAIRKANEIKQQIEECG